jgi:hypothetical protein
MKITALEVHDWRCVGPPPPGRACGPMFGRSVFFGALCFLFH